MARVLGSFPAALIAAREGMSANAFYRELQQLGMGVRRSEALSIYRIARGIVARSQDEPFRDIRQVPTASEISPWPTQKATGFRQTVLLTYRERSTGTLSYTWHSTSGPELVTREQAIANAINAYQVHAEDYDQELVGAVHTSTYEYQPLISE